MLRYFLLWFVLLLLAVANGAIRDLGYGKAMRELRAHQLSTLTGAFVIGGMIWLIVRRWPPASESQAVKVGLMWLGMTIAFETFMGLVLQQRPLVEAMSDYNLLAGRVWVLFLAWLAVAPWCFHRLTPRG